MSFYSLNDLYKLICDSHCITAISSCCLGKTTIKSTQFRSKAAAVAYIKQNINPNCNATLTLKKLQSEIQHHLEQLQSVHKKCGTVGIVALNEHLQFTPLCQGNGDMLVAASNSEKAIYTVTIKFDGVGILGTSTMVMKYFNEWQDVTSLALSGDKLAICVDGKIYIHDLAQEVTRPLTTGSNMSPASLKATSVSWLGKSLVYCEDHCIKLFDNDIVSVISGGNGKGDVDGPAAHSKLCQPVGI